MNHGDHPDGLGQSRIGTFCNAGETGRRPAFDGVSHHILVPSTLKTLGASENPAQRMRNERIRPAPDPRGQPQYRGGSVISPLLETTHPLDLSGEYPGGSDSNLSLLLTDESFETCTANVKHFDGDHLSVFSAATDRGETSKMGTDAPSLK
jgi:hypothetical protein